MTSIRPFKTIDRIDTKTMRSLNAEFDIQKSDARAIARDYLAAEGLITG